MIFAHTPMATKMSDGSTSHSVCTTFKNGNKTISIALDDSCGRMTRLMRSDIRLFIDSGRAASQDVTVKVFPDGRWQVDANLENFQKAWEWLNEEGE